MNFYYAKSILESKVFWVNLLAGIALVLEAREVTDLFNPRGQQIASAILCIVNIILRFDSVRPVALIRPKRSKPVRVKTL